MQIQRDTLLEDFKLLLKDFYIRICTPEQLKLEQRAQSKPKRYFNAKIEEEKADKKPEKRRKKQLPAGKGGKKRLIKSKSLSALS